MAVLTKGTDYEDGDQVTSTNLDAHVDSAVFASGAVDDSTTELSSGAIVVKDAGITPAKLSTGHPTWDTSGNFGSGTTSPSTAVHADVSTATNALPSLNAGTSLVAVNMNTASSHESGISILTASSVGAPGTSVINFGDTSDEDAGEIAYSHVSNAFTFYVNSGTTSLSLANSGNANFSAVVGLKSYTAATLPTGVTGGIIYVSDGERPGDASGSGQGLIAYYDGSNWISVHDGLTVNSGDDRINTQTGTTYTLVLGDAQGIVEMNNASANTLTVPPNSSVAFPIGARLDVTQYGAGTTTIAAGSGVTLRGDLVSYGQYKGFTLYKRGTDEWIVTGGTT